ncbi:hypothetical protein B7R54_10175 [Subtercola boreus]|uniref:SMP-30/Gluconolactonase/LRE-like region domain-containing protein n=1 Tax=Subtercola boreus TaxID=120213 RepID=A0A3E0VHX2_9MICO|nr:hypothetical protein [Subtercola boreus]RFA09544.1 hypothetical protein B7R54_10175 [Subtercola boreus]
MLKVDARGATTLLLPSIGENVEPLDLKVGRDGTGYALFAPPEGSSSGGGMWIDHFSADGTGVYQFTTFPSTASVRSIDFDAAGMLITWVGDELWKFDSSGDHETVVHSSVRVTGEWAMDNRGTTFEINSAPSGGGSRDIRRITSAGKESTFRTLPQGYSAQRIRIGDDGDVYVLSSGDKYGPGIDGEKSVVTRYDSEGSSNSFTLPYWRNPVSGDGFGTAPGATDFVVDSEGAMYTANFGLKAVSRISATGEVTAEFIHLESGSPWSLGLSGDRRLLIAAVPDHDRNLTLPSTIFALDLEG